MNQFININTLERGNEQTNENVALTDFINGVDLEMWHATVQHMEDCAAGQYGNETALTNYAKEWLQRAEEITRMLACRKVSVADPCVVAVAHADSKLQHHQDDQNPL